MTEIKRKFNVGDKVKIIKGDAMIASIHSGRVGGITEVIGYKYDDPDFWETCAGYFRPVITEYNGEKSYFEEYALELVEKANPIENNDSLGFIKLGASPVLPTKAHATDSGFDLYAAEEVTIPPYATAVIPTHLGIILPEGYGATIRGRSGLTSKSDLRVQLGTIDNAYRGELGIIADNKSLAQPYVVTKGMKVAQLVLERIAPYHNAEWREDEEQTDRGVGGFGSTGV